MNLKVTPEELEQHAAHIDSVSDLLIEKHQKLACQMAELLESGWKGTGADACEQAWNEWNTGFRLMINGLGDEAQALWLAASSYRGTDGSMAGQIDDVGRQL